MILFKLKKKKEESNFIVLSTITNMNQKHE
ncbi:Protein CBG27128 [Caenorhabditis briggsae]|uniref:Protein CBG27128 n=1 Tax=Caenorhabditis briggsae TaxID=6238 RepID=B6IHK2_CAEBR|nr:Protein CBG27128 [Caenorhabditis briggsae]CAR99382.1 Protein CBG27128 [Caenorhabditis briggsae]